MKVTLISYTQEAARLLAFVKATRLNMTPSLLSDIFGWPKEKLDLELAYIANTIPSSWEFVDYTFLVEGVSRAYTHQQVRTRAASYAQQSLRVVEAGDFDYVFTPRVEGGEARAALEVALIAVKGAYRNLRAIGIPAEDARGILPTNIATNIVCKFNLRTFSELVKSRSGGRTQDEYSKVVRAMADEVLAVHPWAELFIYPHSRDYFDEIEAWAKAEFPNDLLKRGSLLKIVDKMRKGA